MAANQRVCTNRRALTHLRIPSLSAITTAFTRGICCAVWSSITCHLFIVAADLCLECLLLSKRALHLLKSCAWSWQAACSCLVVSVGCWLLEQQPLDAQSCCCMRRRQVACSVLVGALSQSTARRQTVSANCCTVLGRGESWQTIKAIAVRGAHDSNTKHTPRRNQP